MKNYDASKKKVVRCELCGRYFCAQHSKPKFPYFVDWETQFDVQGNPAVKGMFYSEYGRDDGHPDFVYLMKTIESLEFEEKERNELIKKAMDRMMHSEEAGEATDGIELPIDDEAGRTKRIDILVREEGEIDQRIREREQERINSNPSVKTTGNIHGYHFSVPEKIYSEKIYHERLNLARTLAEVDEIIDNYKKEQRGKRKEEQPKKKHWWQ
ncbi:MAG: hypothetical protein M1490_02295 [Candidatus Bathyarchaeota archaeon]|nr:hypothetical protein [Candidatus Bathyarchaeota archaeon]